MIIESNSHESLIEYPFSHIVWEHVGLADCSCATHDNVIWEDFTALEFLIFLF